MTDSPGSPAPRPDPLRVLVVAPTPFFGDRGCHVRIYEQVKSLAALGVTPLVVTYAAGRDVDVPIRRAPAVPGVDGDRLGPSLGRPWLDLSLLGTTLSAVRRFAPDVVHAHLHEGVAIGTVVRLFGRRPLVADLQGSLTEELIDHGSLRSSGGLTSSVRAVEAWLVRRPDRLVVSSRVGLDVLAAQGVAADRVRVLEDGVDLPAYPVTKRPTELVERFGLAGKRVVVFLGVLTEYQGVDLLLSAVPDVVRAVPDVHFLVMGYPNEDHYRAQVQALGLGDVVTLPGRVPYAEAAQWLALGDVAVSAKQSLTEANGKLLTYMACRLPVVATDTPVNRDLLADLGHYVPVGNREALAAAIVATLADPEAARDRGAALRERAESHFSWPALAARLVDVYRELLGRTSGST